MTTTMTATRKLLSTAASVLALLASANGASAQGDTATRGQIATTGETEVFDSCMAHDWNRFAEAVEANDLAELDRMARDPELRGCGAIVATALLLSCSADPVMCVEPAAGNGEPEIEIEVDIPGQTWPCAANCDRDDDDEPQSAVGPFPGQRPGEQLGIERSRSSNDDGGSGGGSAGGAPSAASSSTPSAPAGRS